MPTTARLITMTFATAVVACGPADSGEGLPAADRAAIERVADSQQVLFNTGKFDEAVALTFAEDAVSLPPNAPAVVGRPAIQAYMKTFPPFRDFSMTPRMIDGRGDLAVVRGNYAMTLSVPGSPAGQKDVGKYLEIWKKQPDGGWKVIRDAFSSDLPTVGPPPDSVAR